MVSKAITVYGSVMSQKSMHHVARVNESCRYVVWWVRVHKIRDEMTQTSSRTNRAHMHPPAQLGDANAVRGVRAAASHALTLILWGLIVLCVLPPCSKTYLWVWHDSLLGKSPAGTTCRWMCVYVCVCCVADLFTSLLCWSAYIFAACGVSDIVYAGEKEFAQGWDLAFANSLSMKLRSTSLCPAASTRSSRSRAAPSRTIIPAKHAYVCRLHLVFVCIRVYWRRSLCVIHSDDCFYYFKK